MTQAYATPSGKSRVFVSGAGGQTGQALFRKLLERPDEFDVVGGVRTEESRSRVLDSMEENLKASSSSCVKVVDITNAEDVRNAMEGCSHVFICSSAKPVMGDVNPDTGRPNMLFSETGQPVDVDWLGQKNQIDAAKELGNDTRVVICSSMGGTDPGNMLNGIGRTTLEDGSHEGGNILLWKRKSEMYLMDSGLPYTIIHPGGLQSEAGGERELVLGVDDSQEGTESRSVPREDVAELMLQSILHSEVYSGRSFDLRAKPVGEGEPTTDFVELKKKWLDGKNTDYTLGKIGEL